MDPFEHIIQDVIFWSERGQMSQFTIIERYKSEAHTDSINQLEIEADGDNLLMQQRR